jgi:hypothetical protein
MSGFLIKAVIVLSVKTFSHSPFSYMLFISYVIILRPSYPNSFIHLQVHRFLWPSYPLSPW